MELKYLALIVKVYEEIKLIKGLTIESKRIEFKKRLFKKEEEHNKSILINQKSFQKTCKKEIKELKKFIFNRIELIRDKKLGSYIMEINLGLHDKKLINKSSDIHSDRKKEIELRKNVVERELGRDYNVNINPLVRTAKNEMCLTDVEFIESFFKNIRSSESLQNETDTLDLSGTSAVEKVIYLNELGIIDFLKAKPEFNASTNLMATFLSSVTGVKAPTLQSSLNRLISDDIEDKNHPYATKKTVNKVRKTFIEKNVKLKTS